MQEIAKIHVELIVSNVKIMYVKNVQMDTSFLKENAKATVHLDRLFKVETVFAQLVLFIIIDVLLNVLMALLKKETAVFNVDNHAKHVINLFVVVKAVFKVSN